jgi:hypothetical protein
VPQESTLPLARRYLKAFRPLVETLRGSPIPETWRNANASVVSKKLADSYANTFAGRILMKSRSPINSWKNLAGNVKYVNNMLIRCVYPRYVTWLKDGGLPVHPKGTAQSEIPRTPTLPDVDHLVALEK